MGTNPFLPSTSGLQPNAGVNGAPGAITAVSTTSQTISSGLLSFQVPNQAAWAPGMIVSVVSSANSNNYMWGTVSSYEGTTLVIDVLGTGGSGTFASWLINISGVGGGGTGPTGPQGPAGTPGSSVAGLSYVNGLVVTNDSGTPNTKVDITGIAVAMTNLPNMQVSQPVSVTVDLTTGTSTATANGMDGEARGTSAWIYLYLIGNGVTLSGLATKTSPLSGLPSFPSGYSYFAYVGAMYVDSSGNLMRTLQKRHRTKYVVTAATNTAALPVMANGSAGSTSTPTWVGVSISAVVPPTASAVHLIANGDVGGAAVAVIVAPNNAYGTAGSTNPPPIAVAAAAGTTYGINELQLESSSIYWASGGTDGYLLCAGWDDYAVSA